MIGAAKVRVDGPLKVTGTATYTMEHARRLGAVHGVLVGAPIARGIVRRLDTTDAERSPGVLAVYTHRSRLPQGAHDSRAPRFTRGRPVFESNVIRYHGEPVALVVATTWEQARAAAARLRIVCERGAGAFDLRESLAQAYAPAAVNAGFPTDRSWGDVATAAASAEVVVDALYETPYQHHAAMEPHASVAVWKGRKLTLYTSAQTLKYTRLAVATTVRARPEDVRIVSTYVGGGFGGKLNTYADAVLAALAARELRRPVAVSMTRPQTFQLVGRRPATVQQVQLASRRDGTLVGLAHDATMQTARFEEYAEQTATSARSLYAVANQRTRHRLVRLDLQSGETMRAPGEQPGLAAVECAMDELAYRLAIDPVELRIRNEPAVDPDSGRPFSSRRLVECLRVGADRFGWDRRPSAPKSRLENGQWIGYGMAAAIRPHFQGPTTVSVRLGADGRLTVLSDMTDIGTGTYTILTQIAAERLGLAEDRVVVTLGDSALPESSGSGGSWGATNSATALVRACDALVRSLAMAAASDGRSPLHGADGTRGVADGGMLRIDGRSEPFAAIAARAPGGVVQAEGRCLAAKDDPHHADRVFNTYGAHFAEVAVDAYTGEVTVRRMLGVFDAGRIFNAKTAESQLVGSMIWGLSGALFEESVTDTRYGITATQNLVDYHVPTHADVRQIQAIFLSGTDPHSNPLGARGVGELGVCGSTAAVANAVFNAVNVRVRSFPITLDKLLPGLVPSA